MEDVTYAGVGTVASDVVENGQRLITELRFLI